MMPPYKVYAELSDSEEESQTTSSTITTDPQRAEKKLKCVLVGDGAVGKTSLIVSYTTNGYPQEYVPTAFDNYSVLVRVDNTAIQLHLCDTAGQDDFDSIRPLCYPQTDVFLLCFSVVNPTSFAKLKGHWLPEIRRQTSAKVPIILVGTQADLRTNIQVLLQLKHYGQQPVSEAEAKSFATSIGAVEYIECSALTQQNLKEVFDSAIIAGLRLNPANRNSVISVEGLKGKKSFRRALKDKLIVLTRTESSRKIVAEDKSGLTEPFGNHRASVPEHHKHQCNGPAKFGKLSQSRSCPPSLNNTGGGLGKSPSVRGNIFASSTLSPQLVLNGSRLAKPLESSPKIRSTSLGAMANSSLNVKLGRKFVSLDERNAAATPLTQRKKIPRKTESAPNARVTGWRRLLCIAG